MRVFSLQVSSFSGWYYISNNIDFWRKGTRLERDMRKLMPKLPRETEFEEAWITNIIFVLLHTSALISLIPFSYLLGTMITDWDGTRYYVWPFIFLVCLLTIVAMGNLASSVLAI